MVDRPAKVRPLHRSARSARLSALGVCGAVAALGLGLLGAVPVGAAPAPAPEVPGAGPGQAPVLSPIPDQGPPTDPVHRLAGGCYTVADADTGRFLSRDGADGYVLTDDAAAAEPFRTRAAALGRFLFYGADHTVVTVDGDRVRAADSPTADADLTVDFDGADYLLTATTAGTGIDVSGDRVAGGTPGRFTLAPAADCATFPEVEVGAEGVPQVPVGDHGAPLGYVDSHVHMTTEGFLGGGIHCGSPFSPLGVVDALADCPDHGQAGETALLDWILSAEDDPLAPHDTVGWPAFDGRPVPGSLTHEQTYYRSVERAWRGGLRMMTNLFVTNDVLCELYWFGDTTCDGMEVMRIQHAQLRAIEDYVDAQHGGPGRGWFRIVTTPAEARAVTESGRLAVVMGVEISDLFGCTLDGGTAQCDEADIDAGLDELKELGIEQVVLVHKFDNALGGTRMDSDFNGLAVNIGNLIATGSFWQVDRCGIDTADNPQPISIPGAEGLPAGALPIYPDGPQCNTRGLSDLGAYAVEGMIAREMTIDVDHLSAAAADQVLTLAEDHRYPRVVSSHSWTDPENYARVLALGGFVGIYGFDVLGEDEAGAPAGLLSEWRKIRAARDPERLLGVGFGSDTNGLAPQAQPRTEGPAGVSYPFTALDGTVMDRQRWGDRVFDVNTDGVAQYGLYPDWLEDARLAAGGDGEALRTDFANGLEARLRTWEGRS